MENEILEAAQERKLRLLINKVILPCLQRLYHSTDYSLDNVVNNWTWSDGTSTLQNAHLTKG